MTPNMTDALIDALPAGERSVLIVGRSDVKRYMEGVILSRRGLDVLHQCRVVVVECMPDCQKLYGVRCAFFIDHRWMPSPDVRRYVDNLIRINQLIRDGKARNKDVHKL